MSGIFRHHIENCPAPSHGFSGTISEIFRHHIRDFRHHIGDFLAPIPGLSGTNSGTNSLISGTNSCTNSRNYGINSCIHSCISKQPLSLLSSHQWPVAVVSPVSETELATQNGRLKLLGVRSGINSRCSTTSV